MMNFAFKMMNFAFKMMFPGSLIPNITGGHTFRLAPVQAMHTRHALAAGMSRKTLLIAFNA